MLQAGWRRKEGVLDWKGYGCEGDQVSCEDVRILMGLREEKEEMMALRRGVEDVDWLIESMEVR